MCRQPPIHTLALNAAPLFQSNKVSRFHTPAAFPRHITPTYAGGASWLNRTLNRSGTATRYFSCRNGLGTNVSSYVRRVFSTGRRYAIAALTTPSFLHTSPARASMHEHVLRLTLTT